MDTFQSLILLSVDSRISFKGVLSLFPSFSFFILLLSTSNSNVMCKGLSEMQPVQKTRGKCPGFNLTEDL